MINALAQRSSLEQEAGNGRLENPKAAHNGGDDEAHRFLTPGAIWQPAQQSGSDCLIPTVFGGKVLVPRSREAPGSPEIPCPATAVHLRSRISVLAVAGVSPREEECFFPRVAGQRGCGREF